MYGRTVCDDSNYYYETIEINVVTDGFYIIASNSSVDIYGYVYNNSFNPFNPSVNLILSNIFGCGAGFQLTVNLVVNITYILVVTSWKENMTGSFSIIVSGPTNTSVTRITYSFNQPKFCPTAAWNPFGTTFANQTTAGRDLVAFFININNTVYTISPDKKQILMWINNSISPNKFISANLFIPISMFVTNNGDIYYENGFDNGRVDKWISNTSTFVTVMNVDSQCYGLFIDNNNTLYCSMYDHHKILKRWLNESEPILTIAAGTGSRGSASNQLFHPFGIFVDLNFDLYVADYYNHRIQLFKSGELNGITIVGEESSNNIISLLYPSGIVLDADKYLFIVDHYYSRIFRSGLNDIRCIIGCDGGGSQSHQLSGPRSLSFDSYGNIFITDSFIHRIQKFDFLPNSCGKFKK
ncbi:unnamed protein product [Adineta steineri]|uniref:NHL repeat containing protein-like protein n=1 Tax=Adineta steineri TaxID=433720 RepID=A0A814I961_9BILA|nr:unnamed protein product [Adineta steineri]